ncbi:hypothetical protein GOBAR_AA00289 [Gossypium barbadense]|uniref:Uncharacterized protein n=1 Tax=Gossypium barbadense TaxID=3634 RepID=A0A2P5YXI1_GOSBA|nr:hypothetical protein GOBAR_AA00289 [Gossypium barbadense]
MSPPGYKAIPLGARLLQLGLHDIWSRLSLQGGRTKPSMLPLFRGRLAFSATPLDRAGTPCGRLGPALLPTASAPCYLRRAIQVLRLPLHLSSTCPTAPTHVWSRGERLSSGGRQSSPSRPCSTSAPHDLLASIVAAMRAQSAASRTGSHPLRPFCLISSPPLDSAPQIQGSFMQRMEAHRRGRARRRPTEAKPKRHIPRAIVAAAQKPGTEEGHRLKPRTQATRSRQFMARRAHRVSLHGHARRFLNASSSPHTPDHRTLHPAEEVFAHSPMCFDRRHRRPRAHAALDTPYIPPLFDGTKDLWTPQ